MLFEKETVERPFNSNVVVVFKLRVQNQTRDNHTWLLAINYSRQNIINKR